MEQDLNEQGGGKKRRLSLGDDDDSKPNFAPGGNMNNGSASKEVKGGASEFVKKLYK